MTQQRVKVADDGSVVLPPEVVRAMGLVPGEAISLNVDDSGLLTARRPDDPESIRSDLKEA
ncbi:AbrB/MazE/SpoVT family DNA-binding domain-containing protein, partial [Mycobacterium tuberculosis]|nr:AbrB/MazE/SpoVT family DNA-binding domain-containing protein [Mycobacterium tuberculosis]